MPPAALAALAAAPPAAGVPDVLARMRDLAAALPDGDGLGAFNAVYLRVTEEVLAALPGATFEDPRFVERLDVVFANLYFDAVARWVRGAGGVPKAWAPLFDWRDRPGILALQFVLAGMNAHINRDLPVAVVATCEELGLAPRSPGPQHADYETVNVLLATAMDEVKRDLATGALGVADDVLGRLDDRLAMWNIDKARDAAWVQAETMWALRAIPFLGRRYLATLDRSIGFAGRGLLLPVF